MSSSSDGAATIVPVHIRLDRSSFVPYYRQIVDQVRGLVQSRVVVPGQPFLTEGDCAQQLGISKMTVRQAYQILRTEGILNIERGRRPLVGTGRIEKNSQELRSFSEEMERRGATASSIVITAEVVNPDIETARALRLEPEDKVYRIERLRFADEVLVGLESSNLVARLFEGLLAQDVTKHSLYSILENHYGVKLGWSEETIEARAASGRQAKLLKVKQGFPLFSTRRIVYDLTGIGIEYGSSLFRGDRYSMTVISHRKR